MSVPLLAFLINVGLAVLKFTVGVASGSRALVADAFNSAGDVLATGVAWGAFHYARVPPDRNHPYGHGNAEVLAALLIGGMLCATGGFICIDGVTAFFDRVEAPTVPDPAAAWAAGATALIKEMLYRISMRAHRREPSPTLVAAARDHRADVVTALVALAGIGLAQLGWPGFDSGAGSVIGIYIAWLGWAPVRDNLRVLMHEAPPELTDRVCERARSVPDVRGVAEVRVQPIGAGFRADLRLQIDGSRTVAAGHELAHRVERELLEQERQLTEVQVHVEPFAQDDGSGGAE